MKIFFLLVIFSLNGCETPEGHIGASRDISEAKKRGVFTLEYTVLPNPYKLNDSLQLTVKQAWIEQRWAYGRGDNTIPMVGYQLCINTTEKDETNIELANATFGIDFNHNLRVSGNDSFLGDFDTIPGDSISYFVQQGDNLMDDSAHKKIILGKLTLIKKPN